MATWTLDPAAVKHVCPWLTDAEAIRIAKGLGAGFHKYRINTPVRAAMAVAQFAHESAGFRATTEFASGAAYEGRRDLGNIHPGDGVKYKGRGRIMITGRSNYEAVSKAFKTDFINHPTKLAQSPYAEMVSCWWWYTHGCSGYADRGDFLGLTRRINGGTNGYESRVQFYARAKQVAKRLVPKQTGALVGLTKSETQRAKALLEVRANAHKHGWTKARHKRADDLIASLNGTKKAIWRVAHQNGWNKYNRRSRYEIISKVITKKIK